MSQAEPIAHSDRRAPAGVEFEAEMLMNIRTAIESHAAECAREPKVILLNPANHELLGWDEVLGLPVLPSERADPMRARLVCGSGKAGYCEDGDVLWDEDGEAWVFVPAAD
jgi:hypothetical protein